MRRYDDAVSTSSDEAQAQGAAAAPGAVPEIAPTSAPNPTLAPHRAKGDVTRRGLGLGVTFAITASLSNQIGASLGALAFPAIGPIGVVSLRQLFSAVIFMSIGRPRLLRMRWSQWWPVLLLGVVFGIMNGGLYLAIDRLGLGLAITLEFLGPLAIVIFASRRLIDLFGGVLAMVGVVVLVHPSPSTDVLGICFGLLSAVGWGSYVLLSREIGRRLPGLQGAGAASLVSAIIWLPIAIFWFTAHPPPLWAIALAAACTLLSSVVPLAADVTALRFIPAGIFSTLQSLHPVWAAVVGLVVLGQALQWYEILGIALVVLSNILVTSTAMHRAR